ncbi:MAG TPA: hypothetical protein VF532_09790 [Candidatus Angelobacter sp.]
MKLAFLLALAVILPLNLAAQPQTCMSLKKVETEFSALSAGSGTILYLHFARSGTCHILAPGGQTPSLPELAIEPFPGLEVKSTDLSFGKSYHLKDAALQGARDLLLTVYLGSVPEIATGQHQIPAALTYTALDAKGNLSTETLKFDLPLKVVAQGTAVKYQDPASKLRAKDYILIIVLAPVLIPLSLIMWLAGWDGC